MKKRTNKKTKYIIIVSVLVLFFLSSVAFLEATGKVNFFGNPAAKNSEESDAKTTSDAPTAQEDFTEGGERTPNTSSNDDEATVTDNSGNIGTVPASSQWSYSANQQLVVYSPTANQVLSNGSKISGKSTEQTVSFRLIGDSSGVIAQGQLAVGNGNFSGTFNFDTAATEGRLDVFNTKSDGVEFNNVEIPIRFR